jgi:hypothetical protein
MSFELLPSRQRKSGSFGLPDDASKNAEIAVACLVWFKGCRRDSVDITTGVPQIAADLLHVPSRQSQASAPHLRRLGRD